MLLSNITLQKNYLQFVTMVSDSSVEQTSHLHICSNIDKNTTGKSNHMRLLAPKKLFVKQDTNWTEHPGIHLEQARRQLQRQPQSSILSDETEACPQTPLLFPPRHWTKREWKRDEESALNLLWSSQPLQICFVHFSPRVAVEFACVTTFVSPFHCLLVMPPACKCL